MFVALAGLPASGKSTIAKALQLELAGVLLDKDRVRAFLFGGYTDYTRAQDDLCMNTIYDTACYLAAKYPALHLILDGRTYSRHYQIQALEQAAARAASELRLIECICSDAAAEQRLRESGASHPAMDRDFALYQRSKAAAEAIARPRLVLDTEANSVHSCTRRALAYIGADD